MHPKEYLYIQIDALSRLTGKAVLAEFKKTIGKRKSYPVGWDIKEMNSLRDRLCENIGAPKTGDDNAKIIQNDCD